MERAFGILQSRWAIIHHSCTLHHKSVMTSITLACIILHNMTVDEEYVEDEEEEGGEESLQNPSSAFQAYDGPVDLRGNRIRFEPISRDGANMQWFHDHVADLESVYIHRELQRDLVKHI